MAASNRDRIIEAAAALLAEGGRDAVSTRAVSAAAGVQAPAIYRAFGDKQGLLDAVADHGFVSYLRGKQSNPVTDDPVADLRRGWDLHVGFGLAHPALYSLIYGDPRIGESPAARQGSEILAGMIHRIAEAGRLRVTEERAMVMVQAAGRGMTLTLISLPEDQRDPSLSEAAREAVIAAITTDAPPEEPRGGAPVAAVALRAVLPRTTVLTAAERALLAEWLDRIATAGEVPAAG
ncbi:TetR/AcrR family transcriptional regulator [Allonocardiopsis opalescens]|uniref:TetR family transcriptional regulator n=1 Tax=Allonocardiopsis opalescens TaxID=1144618 RepID=A0A2T0QEU7_9ACTN|nr:TetR/AcrR family transcriptional regulator [Allonocardiopsis opalescens]PRY02449.1 TetR family transcriptional regulator [Allonocardiopsis opalescens]